MTLHLAASYNPALKELTDEERQRVVTQASSRVSFELQRNGKIPGAVHVNRGMLEFVLDPTLPYHNPVFSSGKKVLFYCASGGRSALAADTAQSMGLERVSHLGGGFKSWKEANGPTEKA